MERRTFFGTILSLLFGTVAAKVSSQDGPVQAVKVANTKVGMSNAEELVLCQEYYTKQFEKEMTVDEIRARAEQIPYNNCADLASINKKSYSAFTIYMPYEVVDYNAPIMQMLKDDDHRKFAFECLLCHIKDKRVMKITSDGEYVIRIIPVDNEIRMNFGWADERIVQL